VIALTEAIEEVMDYRERFVNFLKSFQDKDGAYKYRDAIAQTASQGKTSLVIDFDDLISFDPDLAHDMKEKPNEFLPKVNSAIYDVMRVENMQYAGKVKTFKARFRKLDEVVPLRSMKSAHMGKLIMIEGIITRASAVKQLLRSAVFQCPRCGEKMVIEQASSILMPPPQCANEGCARKGFFRLIPEESTFVDWQLVSIQERPEELPPGQLPRTVEGMLQGDIVDISRPGDRISMCGILQAKQEFTAKGFRLATFSSGVEANHLEIAERGAEEVAITTEDEKKIKALAADPNLYTKLIGSIAPSIYAYDDIKEAVAYQLAGGVSKQMPDIKIRGDINVLLVGDPGCLVSDERVILDDGSIVKIGQMGHSHLQPLDIKVQTGQGSKRAVAKAFHIYRDQPVMEVITESGKSIKGTYNHPLLVVSSENGRLKREWRRLDELQLGDRLAVVSGFNCRRKAYLNSGFAPIHRNIHGPKFHRKLPSKMTPDLAAFYGYMLGDGWICKDGYHFGFVVANPEVELLPELLRLTKELFGFDNPSATKAVKKGRTVPLHYVYLSDKDIAVNLAFMRTKRVPDIILQSGNEVVASFLKWFYQADGCVFNKGRGRRAVGLKAKEIELLRDVQLLLLRFGIHSRIIGNSLLIRRGEDIIRFSKHVGFVSATKRSTLEKLAHDAQSFKRFKRQRSERIVKITKHGNADVYDIEVPEGNRFVANGIISHNTAKSQLLQYVSRIAPRGVYTSGKGSTAAGLTATVVRDKNTGEYFLEAGALVIADKGIACLHPDSRIILDGRILRMGDLAANLPFVPIASSSGVSEIAPLSASTFGLDLAELDAKFQEATKIRRKWHSGRILTIHLKSGFVVKATPDHLLLDGDTLEWKAASSFRTGELLTGPLKLPSPKATEILLWDILPGDCTVSLTTKEKDALRILLEGKYGSLKSASEMLDIERITGYYSSRLQPTLHELRRITNELGVDDEWRYKPHVYSKSPILVSKLTPELAYICGFIFGDGNVRISKRRSAITLTQSPKNSALMEQFETCWASAFSPMHFRKPRESKFEIRGKRYAGWRVDWSVSRRVLGYIYEYITRDNLSGLVSLPDPLLNAFLAGLTDSDGCLSMKTSKKGGIPYGSWNIIYEVSRNEDANLNLMLALRRLDCLGSYRGLHGGVGVVVVSSRRDVCLLQGALSPYSAKLRGRVPFPRVKNISGISEKLPKKPVAALFKAIYEGANRPDLIDRGIWSTVYAYMHENRQPSAGQVLKVMARTPFMSDKHKDALKTLAKRDYFLDEITRIEEEDYDGYVYDLMMADPPHNYFSDGVFSHNCIDEIDKMRPEDRSAIHEAMEQQTISIAKAGIVVQLNARSSILAAANPSFGRYVPQRTVAENINDLPVTILSRFDLIFTLIDRPDEMRDKSMTEHILSLHQGVRLSKESIIDPILLKKFLYYVRKYGKPDLGDAAAKEIEKFFLEMRAKGQGPDSPVPITMRQLEAVIRLSEARAKLALKKEVTKEDVAAVIRLLKAFLSQVGIDQSTGKMDIDTLMVGHPKSQGDKMSKLFDIFMAMEKENEGRPIKREAFVTRAGAEGIEKGFVEKMIGDWSQQGVIYEPRPGELKKA